MAKRINEKLAEEDAEFLLDLSALGINKSTVYRIFGGKVTPDTETIRLMEVALGISDTPPAEPEIIDQKESDTIRNLLKIQDRRVAQLRASFYLTFSTCLL